MYEELTERDRQNLIACIDGCSITGKMAEDIVLLKKKVIVPLPEKEKEDDTDKG